MTQKVLRSLLHFSEHKRTNLTWRVLLSACLDPRVAVIRANNLVRHGLDITLGFGIRVLSADQTLDGKQRVFRVGDGLSLGRSAHQSLAIRRECDNGWSCSVSLPVFNDTRLSSRHDRDARVGGSQIDTDHDTRVRSGGCQTSLGNH
mmetsp:Transcript_21328/g.36657  ORF Transcript_21328/g.36657 Transcript_21328/m.36657 type:complete len:147 (+) Transcript_21328:1677-2117(+)